MAISNLATGRPVDGWGAGPTLALPGFAFGVMTVLTLYAPTLLWLSPGKRRCAIRNRQAATLA